MSHKILCAVDDSDHSKTAVTQGAEMAKAMGAELVLLTVNLPVGAEGRGAIAIFTWEDDDLKRVLSDASEIAKKAGVSNVKTVGVKSRDAARSIVAYSEDNGVDHIVVGTGGKGVIARMMIGSVSSDVIARAHCPVTVAR